MPPSIQCENVPLITENEPQSALFGMLPIKAPGAGGIQPVIIRALLDILHHSLLKIYNFSLELAFYPVTWRASHIGILRKILEKVFMKRLQHQVETQSWLSKHQFGFRTRHAAIDAMLNVMETVKQAFQRQMRATCVNLDIEGAYDDVSHQNPIDKLQHLHCGPDMLKWMITYLSGKTLCTIANGEKSEKFRTVKGLPRGSSLSPLLSICNLRG